MIRSIPFITAIMLMGLSLAAQQKSQIVSTTQGDNLGELAETSFQYVFPVFTEGNVVYKNGKTIPGVLNYNILLGEMQFVDPDTQRVLSIVDLHEVTMVKVGKRFFVPFTGKEFLEILSAGTVQLAARYKGNRLSHGRQTPYGNSTPSARSSDMTAVDAGGYMSSLEAKENIRITVDTYYYIVGDKKQTLFTGSKSFLKAFPKEKSKAILQFIQQNNINFNNRNDLLVLMSYCDQM
jgi:hypothetical protein